MIVRNRKGLVIWPKADVGVTGLNKQDVKIGM
jgi:hypothetical protein